MTNRPINVQSLTAQTIYMATILCNTWARGGYCPFVCQNSLYTQAHLKPNCGCISVICCVCMEEFNS